jgi:FtsZ-binding cell division protein ZapB
MPQPFLLEGQVDDRNDRIASLQQELAQVREENRILRSDLVIAKRDAVRSLSALRKQMLPWYQAMQHLFGEIDSVMGDDPAAAPTAANVNDRTRAVWESWKSKLGGGAAKCIDALLLHGEMNTQQLSIATGYHRTTIPTYIFRLNQAGLINKSGGKFSLKEL